MGARRIHPTEPLERLGDRIVGVVRGRIELEEGFEGSACAFGLTRVEVGPAKRLEDRALARLEPIRSLEDDRGLREMAPLQQRMTALQQIVGRLAVVAVVIGLPGLHVSDGATGEHISPGEPGEGWGVRAGVSVASDSG